MRRLHPAAATVADRSRRMDMKRRSSHTHCKRRSAPERNLLRSAQLIRLDTLPGNRLLRNVCRHRTEIPNETDLPPSPRLRRTSPIADRADPSVPYLVSFLSILLEKHDVSPCRRAEVAGVVVGISRPCESVVRHLVPFFARDLASLAADANTRVGEETNLDVILHVGMFSLIGAFNSFADHDALE